MCAFAWRNKIWALKGLAIGAAILLAWSLAAAGCGLIVSPIHKNKTSVVFVTGIHQSSVYPIFQKDKDKLIDAWESEGEYGASQVTVFNAALGASAHYTEHNIPINIDWSAAKTTVAKQADAFFAGLPEAIKAQVKPENDGADYMEAISQAALSIKDNVDEQKIIYVSGSGLSDSGVLNFADFGYLDGQFESKEDFLSRLRQDVALSSGMSIDSEFNGRLEGYTIVWEDIGSTSYPQLALRQPQQANLRQIYEWMLESYGAFVDDIRLSSAAFHQEAPLDVGGTVVKPVAVDGFTYRGVFDETSALGFMGDRPRYMGDPECFLNEEDAAAELDRIAQLAKAHPRNTITVTGYIAKLPQDSWLTSSELSRRRAETVAERLKGLGVANEFVIDDKGNSESEDREGGRQEDRRVVIEF